MKKLVFSMVVSALITAICLAAGGVGVGNGKSVYKSPYGFSVQYESNLSLSVLSNEVFSISNEPLVQKEEKPSHISFLVKNTTLESKESLREYLREQHPELQLQETRQPGAVGFFHEEITNESLIGAYFFLTSNHALIEIRLEAFSAGDGLKWVAPIVHSLTYDQTPPEFQELQVDTNLWQAGNEYWIRFRATDDNSGIALEGASIGFDRIDETGNLQRAYFGSNPDHLVKLTGDWYETKISLGKYLPPGRYLLSFLMIRDNAMNVRTLALEQAGQRFYEQGSGPRIPVVAIDLKNPGQVDVSPPVYLGYRFQESSWLAGKSHKIFFEFSDKESGIDVNGLSCLGLRSSFEVNESTFRSQRCGRFQKEEGNWYSTEIALNEYLPTGEYYLEGLDFVDLAGNRVVYGTNFPFDGYYYSNGVKISPVIRVQVVNQGKEDSVRPVLGEFRLDDMNWKVGETYRLHFRATDNLSGIAVGKRAYGYFIKSGRSQKDLPIYTDTKILSEGNDWYAIELQVNPFIPGGIYYLNFFTIQDRAGNEAYFVCEDLPNGCKDPAGNLSPVLKINVIR